MESYSPWPFVTLHDVFKVRLRGSTVQRFIPFRAESYSVVWIDHILFIRCWAFGLFPFGAIMNNAARNMYRFLRGHVVFVGGVYT